MQPVVPKPYGRYSYPRPSAPVHFAQRITMSDGAQIATFVYGPDNTKLNSLLAHDPVFTLHGNGGCHGTFVNVIDRLVTAGLGVIAIDTRAHGLSSRGKKPLTYELLAEDAYVILSQLGAAPVHVVGHSDGGIEALLLARDHGDAVASIIAGGANLTPEGVVDEWDTQGSVAHNKAWAHWIGGVEVPRTVDKSLLPSATEAWSHAELLQLMIDEPHIDASSLSAISCPTCVLVGEHDCIKREETEAIAAAIPHSRLVTIPNMGHSLPRLAPDSVACQVMTNVLLSRT